MGVTTPLAEALALATAEPEAGPETPVTAALGPALAEPDTMGVSRGAAKGIAGGGPLGASESDKDASAGASIARAEAQRRASKKKLRGFKEICSGRRRRPGRLGNRLSFRGFFFRLTLQ